MAQSLSRHRAVEPSPATGRALRLAHRLRMRLEESGNAFDLLASFLGVSPRTLTRLSTWSGPSATALLLLAELPVHEVPQRVESLLRLRGADESRLSNLLAALRHEAMQARPGASLVDLIEQRLDWVYWATSERADASETTRLAREEHVICRPLLENSEEVHGYLFALRPGDRVLLAYDDVPVTWFELIEGDAQPEGLDSSEHAALASEESTYLIHHLPNVFRFIGSGTPLGRSLGAGERPYRCFDGRRAGSKRSYFSGLAVRELPELEVDQWKLARGRGQRSRMTRFRGRARTAPG